MLQLWPLHQLMQTRRTSWGRKCLFRAVEKKCLCQAREQIAQSAWPAHLHSRQRHQKARGPCTYVDLGGHQARESEAHLLQGSCILPEAGCLMNGSQCGLAGGLANGEVQPLASVSQEMFPVSQHVNEGGCGKERHPLGVKIPRSVLTGGREALAPTASHLVSWLACAGLRSPPSPNFKPRL